MATMWNPLEALRRDVDRAFHHTDCWQEPALRTAVVPGQAARRYPLMNFCEDHDQIYIEALAPGLDAATLDLAVLGNVLTLSGEKRRHPEGIQPEAFHRSERAAGKFVRSIALPVAVDAAQVSAEYKHGLLIVTLPKAEAAKPKKIRVSVHEGSTAIA